MTVTVVGNAESFTQVQWQTGLDPAGRWHSIGS